MRKKDKCKLESLPKSLQCPLIPEEFETIPVFGKEHQWFQSHIEVNHFNNQVQTQSIIFCSPYLIKNIPTSCTLIADATYQAASAGNGIF